jgi:hypothetical protein
MKQGCNKSHGGLPLFRLIVPLVAFAAFAPLFPSNAGDEGQAKSATPEAQQSLPASARANTPGGAGAAGFFQQFGELKEGGSIMPDGRAVDCDLPVQLRKKNIGSPPPNGPGCCVFRSAECAADYQNIPTLDNFAEWMVENRIEGGGWPEKVDKLIAQIAKSRNMPPPAYVQHTKGDPEFLWRAIKTGRMPCITYDGRDMHYGPRTRIAHMVNLVGISPPGSSPRFYTIMDNNFVGASQLVHLTEEDFLSRWRGTGGGWAFVLLNSPPMPVPHN